MGRPHNGNGCFTAEGAEGRRGLPLPEGFLQKPPSLIPLRTLRPLR